MIAVLPVVSAQCRIGADAQATGRQSRRCRCTQPPLAGHTGPSGQIGIGAFAQQQVDRVRAPILGRLIKRRGPGYVACINRRTAF